MFLCVGQLHSEQTNVEAPDLGLSSTLFPHKTYSENRN